jgi:hypothetical protein
MPKYVCNLYGENNWYKNHQEIAKLTFESEEETKIWFEKRYPLGKLIFSGFHTTE